jgi:hypothetical protein
VAFAAKNRRTHTSPQGKNVFFLSSEIGENFYAERQNYIAVSLNKGPIEEKSQQSTCISCKPPQTRIPSFSAFAASRFLRSHPTLWLKERASVQKTYRLIIVSLFGSIMFVTRLFVPPPISSLLIATDAVLFALATLFVKTAGATYVGLVGGVLTGLSRPSLIPFSIMYTFLYGVLVDAFVIALKVKATNEGVNRNRLIAAMALATMLISFTTYYANTLFPQLVQQNLAMDMMVAFMGPATGATAGYAAAYLWNKYLKGTPL